MRAFQNKFVFRNINQGTCLIFSIFSAQTIWNIRVLLNHPHFYICVSHPTRLNSLSEQLLGDRVPPQVRAAAVAFDVSVFQVQYANAEFRCLFFAVMS